MHMDVSWGEWALAAIVPGLTSLVLIPLILYKVYPPEVKETPEASQLAKQKVAEMGKMHREEWVMLGVFFLLLLLWILGDQLAGIDSATTALFGLSVLLITGVLTWKDSQFGGRTNVPSFKAFATALCTKYPLCGMVFRCLIPPFPSAELLPAILPTELLPSPTL
jgi:di/tricarboxylate transporter